MPHWPYQKWISIGWTAVWCSCLIALGNILTNEPEVYGLLLLSSTFEIPPEHLVVLYIPLFVISGWIGGLAVCHGLFFSGRAIYRLLRQIRKLFRPPVALESTLSARAKDSGNKSGDSEIYLSPALAANVGETSVAGVAKSAGGSSVKGDAVDIGLQVV